MDVTVGICTWDRAGLLATTLERLRDLRVPAGVRWEIVVVDNNCTDSTPAVLDRYAKLLPLRAVRETNQGHSHARNRAVAEARGALVCWTDDDVLVHPDWLAHLHAAAAAHPWAAYLGGPVRPWFEADPPAWVRDNLSLIGYCWALVDYGSEVRELAAHEYPYGANLAFRTDVLRRHPFDPAFGRVKGRLSSGDDTRVVDAVRADGGRGVWVGPAAVDHFIPVSRMTPAYVQEIVHWAGYHGFAPFADDAGPRLNNVPRWLVRRRLLLAARRRLLSVTRGRAWVRALHDGAKAGGLAARFRAEAAT